MSSAPTPPSPLFHGRTRISLRLGLIRNRTLSSTCCLGMHIHLRFPCITYLVHHGRVVYVTSVEPSYICARNAQRACEPGTYTVECLGSPLDDGGAWSILRSIPFERSGAVESSNAMTYREWQTMEKRRYRRHGKRGKDEGVYVVTFLYPCSCAEINLDVLDYMIHYSYSHWYFRRDTDGLPQNH